MLFLQKLWHNKVIRYAYVGWFAIALFYFYQYILRVAPGVLVDDLRQTFRINAEQFATLGAFYLLAYALLQIPLGILVDRIGVKKMCLYSVFTCTAGALLMASTDTFWIAQLSRFIIGAGSASAFMCALKFIADHIAPGGRGLLMGTTLALGTIGALSSGKMVQYLDVMLTWRDVVLVSACIGIFVFIAISFIVKGAKHDKSIVLNHKPFMENLKDVGQIFKSRNIIIYAILAIGLYTPISALADLWGTAFIKQKFDLDKSTAAQLTMTLYLGLTVGSLILPWLSEKYNILNKSIIICSFALLAAFSALIYMPAHSVTFLVTLLFVIGFFGGAEMMCFTGALVESHKHDSGHIIGVVNTLNMLGGALMQQSIGYFLDLQWSGALDSNEIRLYSTAEFEKAISILTLLIAMCCISSLWLATKKKRLSKEFDYK